MSEEKPLKITDTRTAYIALSEYKGVPEKITTFNYGADKEIRPEYMNLKWIRRDDEESWTLWELSVGGRFAEEHGDCHGVAIFTQAGEDKRIVDDWMVDIAKVAHPLRGWLG